MELPSVLRITGSRSEIERLVERISGLDTPQGGWVHKPTEVGGNTRFWFRREDVDESGDRIQMVLFADTDPWVVTIKPSAEESDIGMAAEERWDEDEARRLNDILDNFVEVVLAPILDELDLDVDRQGGEILPERDFSDQMLSAFRRLQRVASNKRTSPVDSRRAPAWMDFVIAAHQAGWGWRDDLTPYFVEGGWSEGAAEEMNDEWRSFRLLLRRYEGTWISDVGWPSVHD